MEGKEDLQGSGVIQGEDVPDTYWVAARSENPSQFSESSTLVAPVSALEPAVAPPVAAVTPAVAVLPAAPVNGTEVKKKRGRPRKYGPEGKSVALSPMPISASVPLAWKRKRGKPTVSYKKKHNLEFESPGQQVAYSVGANFTPHLITVNAGEDVMMRIISFSQQGSRVICILAASGAISNVTLHQPNSCGGTLTYEGRFEILSLSGLFMPTDSGGTKSRTGGMSVSLAGPDGRVLGGGLAGLLVAAGPVQVVIGSFLSGYQQEQNPKKKKFDLPAAFSPIPANHISQEVTDGVYSAPKQSFTPASYHENNLNSMHRSNILGMETNSTSLPGGT